MSHPPAQPVGERIRFQPSIPPPGARGRGDWLTPARQGAAASSPFQAALRRGTLLESGKSANPFTPRVDRSAAPAEPRPLAWRGTAGRTSGSYRLDQLGGVAAEAGIRSPLAGAAAEYPPPGGAGAWPSDRPPALGIAGGSAAPAAASDGGALAGDAGPRSPFARPKSPATRPASPHRSAKKLPSFLLGAAPAAKSPAASTPYAPDTALSIGSPSAPFFDAASPRTATHGPASSRPMSPRFTRRLSSFGSNDMLSGAYRSTTGSAASHAAGAAAALDDAPPTLTLDDMDAEHAGGFSNAGLADADVFAALPESSGLGAPGCGELGPGHADSGDAASSEQDYEDVRIRAVVVGDLPAGAEASALSYFRSAGEILAFRPVPATAVAGSLALLFAEPWQAQQAIARGGDAGRVLLDGRILVRVDWADAQCTSLLFCQVFPGRPLPKAATQPPPESLTFSQAVYSQSPRKRPAPLPPAAGRLRAGSVQESPAKRRAGVGSPFRQQRPLAPRAGSAAAAPAASSLSSSTTMVPSDGLSGAPSVLRAPGAAKPRNGLIQSAMDILFGW
ncbi:hypothetical protein H4R18_002041 [Coemansia javaensis]|uniref:Uncharacterized protein n=1 Tax=Coemansia javaensis TaxID=2761396 RepID=A0A9W8HG87_9FUNG|nr:hypothetical protein H4R18_002041 [Coemansia javaensis]